MSVQKTTAHRRFVDNVPEEVKNDRLRRMIAKFREIATEENQRFVGREEVILIEGVRTDHIFNIIVFNIPYLF